MSQPAAIRPAPILDEAATRLLESVAAKPLAPMRVFVQAPGGYGKTTVLAELAERYRAAGVPVIDTWDTGNEDVGEAVVLVDDAHQLVGEQYAALCRLIEVSQARIAVAARPWPRPAGLGGLAELFGRYGQSLTLSRWQPEQLASYLVAAGAPASARSRLDWLHAQTGGVPRLVDLLLAALDEVGEGLDAAGEPELPDSALGAFRFELDRLNEDVLRFVLASDAGIGLDADLLAALLDRDPETLGDVVTAARATGLFGPNGDPLPVVRLALRSWHQTDRLASIRLRLAELRLQRGGSVLDLARSLLGNGITGARVATVFSAAANEALAERPAFSCELFAAAHTAGKPVVALAGRWAQAAALAGDLDSALRLADQVIAREDSPDRAIGALVAATALVHRGQLARGTELYQWSGTGSSVAFGVIGLLGTGALDAARRLLERTSGHGPPTLLAGAASLMAQGVAESVTGSTTTALATVVRAAALLEPAGAGVLLPDSPAALAALIALHCGELDLAESVLERAVTANLGGTLLAVRHRLLQAWIHMVRGRLTLAAEYLAMVSRTAGGLEPRDWLFAVALEVGLARRNSDLGTLRQIWGHACEAVMRHSVDLFTLLPLGEFAIAAARLRDQHRLVPHLNEATELLGRLGNPPLWTSSMRWSGLHAAIIAEQNDLAKEHATALAEHGQHDRYGAALAAAAQCWLAVIAGRVDPVAVRAAADGLDAVGLSWDGARLAGQAAIRTADRKAMVGLLECARQLQSCTMVSRSATVPRSGAAPSNASDGGVDVSVEVKLSEREREVAALVLDGLTYKQIGDRLFISAKTVEHHMARMRQRLRATSRSDLLAQLRQLTTPRHD